MKIAIVDDSKDDRERLAGLLQKQLKDRGYSVCPEQFPDGETFLQTFRGGNYDIVFLDIYMRELNGIQTAQRIRETDRDVRLIFCTTSNEFASESYAVRADDYILKPYESKTLSAVLDRLALETLQKQRMLTLPDGQRLLLSDILYTSFSGHYVSICQSTGQTVRVRMTQGDFVRLLQPYAEFVCCNRGMLVNLQKVEKMDQDDFLMQGGERVPISRRKTAEIKKQYGDYLIERMRRGGRS